MVDLKDKHLIIPGGAKNLGGAFARRAGADGARITVHFNSGSSRADAEETVAAVEAAGGQSVAVQADLTVLEDVDRLFSTSLDRYGPLYATVSTTGRATGGMVIDTPEQSSAR